MIRLTMSFLSAPLLLAVAALAVTFAVAAYGIGMLNTAVHAHASGSEF